MILDTNAVSALFDGEVAVADRLAESDSHHLPVIVIGEYRYGLIGSRRRVPLERLLLRLERESVVLYPDTETATHYAEVRHQLRTDGRPIPENDVWIAALARQHGLEVASNDAHFDYVKGISRVGW